MLEFAVHLGGPCAIRYPKGSAYQGLEEFESPIQYGRSEDLLKVRNWQLFPWAV